MKASTLETWVWVLIYGGLLAVSLGLFVMRQDAVLGTVVTTIGGVTAAVGVVLIYVRSRLGDSGQGKARP
jgi:uncharacterized membrane-anchored protein YitT (DUF2179 family)